MSEACRPCWCPPMRELRLVHEWLDNGSGIGLIIAGMTHQGFTVSLGEHGVGRWIAVFYRAWRP